MKVTGGTEEDKNIDDGRLMKKEDAIRKGAHSKYGVVNNSTQVNYDGT